ncbi:PREDICTED: uridine phosphorylase 1-like [Papilio polytes]|uniref:uridine phosphorylase 1-like n=1 Tax=Papilio polytes TaxID=76194 RepID=UPI000676A412|nr:PREDICTED: uridine phosphorylase 1-like [Papilio polytes]
MPDCDCDYMLPTKEGWEEHYDNCISKWNSNVPCPKYADGSIRLLNKNLAGMQQDFIYHLGLDTAKYDLKSMFGDVKFVCMGGTKYRMKEFAKHMAKILNIDYEANNLSKHSHRYAMYKVGPVISVSHGIGISSMTILLQEILKVLYYAKVKNPIIFRIGTSGGLKIPAGSIVISSWGLNGTLEKTYDLPVLGKIRKIPSVFDKRLVQELQSMVTEEDGFITYSGGTMAADDFYRGQARLDGPFCDYTSEEKQSYLQHLCALGVRNIEMEATAFAAMAREAAVRAADVCVTLLDRLNGDQVTTDKELLLKYQERPMVIVGRYIAKYYEKINKT